MRGRANIANNKWVIAALAGMLYYPSMAQQPIFDIAPQTSAQKADSASYLQSYFYNGVGLLKRPLHWDKENWFVASGTLVFSFSVLALDDALNETIRGWDNRFARQFGRTGDALGSLPAQFGLSAGALAFGAMAKHPPLIHFGLDNLQAQTFTTGLVVVIKHLTHRSRPFTGNGPFKWYGPFSGWEHDSFVSGHAALGFSTAHMTFLNSAKKWWVGVLSYGAATAIGASRMQQQKHWATDVVLGAVLGSAVSNYVYNQQQKRRQVRQGLKPLP